MKGRDANGQRRPQNATLLRPLPNANPLSGRNGATFDFRGAFAQSAKPLSKCGGGKGGD